LPPDGSISFTQVITLELDAATQNVDVVTVGDPDVFISLKIRPFLSKSKAAGIIKGEIEKALVEINPTVSSVFGDAKTTLVAALRSIESSAGARYGQLEITSHGVIIRGDLSTAGRFNPINQFEPTSDGGFTAFEAWIPGGTVHSYTWSWVEYPTPHLGILGGTVKVVTIADSFLLPNPAPGKSISRVCLRLNGQRFLTDGQPQSVNAGVICELEEPTFTLDAPSWWDAMMIPVWRPDIRPETRLSDAIVAHVSVQTDRPQRELTDNAIVFFPDWASSSTFDALARGLEKMQRRTTAPTLLVIVPAGAFDTTRREFEARLAALPAEIGTRVQVAEDTAGGWSRSFEVKQTPAAFLINARRQFVWSASGYLDPDEIAAALDRHIVALPPRRFRRTGLRVAAGQRTPDVVFEDDQRQERALHRLLGQSVMLTFWESASGPSLLELRRLQSVVDANPRSAPFVVGFHGGTGLDTFDELRKTYGISFSLVHDREHRAARTFGIRCWPTTIAIDPHGVITSVQLGAKGEREDKGL
jgi:peroxiredoxin